MHENLDQPVSLAELCSVTNVSERTLRRAFMEVVGLSPIAFLKAIRLNRTRADLEQASPSKATVTSIATRSGFVHLSRFSQEYGRFFGELPSETLRRNGTR